MQAPSQAYLDRAMKDTAKIVFANKYPADGSASETIMSTAFSTIAMAIASGRQDEIYVERYVSSVRKMLTDKGCMPNLSAGLDSRQHSPMVYAIALLWNNDTVISRFTVEERSKLETFMKAALFSSAYTLSDKNETNGDRGAQRIDVNGDDNCWNGGNPNYSEPNLTIFYSAAFALGLENVSDLMKTFDFDTFVGELEQQGLTSIVNCYNAVNKFGTLERKKEMMNAIIRSDQWEFKGVTLNEFLANPMSLYYSSQIQMWDHIAQDGDYMGQLGMEHEFDSTDAAGRRQSSGYAAYGIDQFIKPDINALLWILESAGKCG